MQFKKYSNFYSSIVFRLAIMVTLTSIIALLIGFIGAKSLLTQYNVTHERQMLQGNANLIAGLINSSSDINQLTVPSTVKYLLNDLDSLGLSYSLVTEKGIVASGLRAPRVDSQLVFQLAAGGSVSGEIASEGVEFFVEGRPILGGRGLIIFQEKINGSIFLNELNEGLILILFIGVIISLVIAIAASRQIAKPLHELETFAKDLTKGKKGLTAYYKGVKEVENLLLSLNNLSVALKDEELQQKKFLLSVTHELKTPLTSILAYSKALEDGIIEQNDYNKTFSILRIESLKLESYVKDIIDLAKYRARRFNIDPSYFLIEGIFNELNNVWLSKLEDLYPEENRLLSFPDFQDINIFSDRQRVLQILDLLIDNSFKAGSTITELNSYTTPSSIYLRVIDNGNGLSDEDLKLLFDDSAIYDKYRKEKRVGSGIGLALAKEIVDALQGNIHARPNSPQGAIFEIEIPLTYLVKDVQITDISPRITMGI